MIKDFDEDDIERGPSFTMTLVKWHGVVPWILLEFDTGEKSLRSPSEFVTFAATLSEKLQRALDGQLIDAVKERDNG